MTPFLSDTLLLLQRKRLIGYGQERVALFPLVYVMNLIAWLFEHSATSRRAMVNKITVLFFTHNDCGVCKAMYPTWNKATETLNEYDYILVDCDISLDKAREYDVSTLPSFLKINNGMVVSRKCGFINETSFMEWLR
jgi:thioredoxin 1